jgi:hypothetical protein
MMSTPQYAASRPRSPSPFLYDGYGWSCPHCINIPYHIRAPGSYYRSRSPPSIKDVGNHLSVCQSFAASNPSWHYDPEPSLCYPPPSHHTPHPSHSNTYYPSPTVPSPQPTHRWYSDTSLNNDQHYYRQHQAYTTPDHRHLPYPPKSDVKQPCPQYYQESPPGAYSSQLPPTLSYAAHKSAVKLLTTFDEENEYNNEEPLVLPEDKSLLTDYFYFVNKQLKRCEFNDEDRKTKGGKRESIEVGFAGLQCIHCAVNVSGSRKFFWSDVNRLANSFSEITRHLHKCRLCPSNIKLALKDLKQLHPEQMARLPRGSQTEFLRKMWGRLHHEKKEATVNSPAGISELDSSDKDEVRYSKKRRL